MFAWSWKYFDSDINGTGENFIKMADDVLLLLFSY